MSDLAQVVGQELLELLNMEMDKLQEQRVYGGDHKEEKSSSVDDALETLGGYKENIRTQLEKKRTRSEEDVLEENLSLSYQLFNLREELDDFKNKGFIPEAFQTVYDLEKEVRDTSSPALKDNYNLKVQLNDVQTEILRLFCTKKHDVYAGLEQRLGMLEEGISKILF